MTTPSKKSQDPLIPNEILRAIYTYLPPSDIARAASVSQLFNKIAKDDATWLLIAKNLNLPFKNKAQVIDYYKRMNEFSEGFLKLFIEEDFSPILSKDPITRHAQLRQIIFQKRDVLYTIIYELNESLKKNPKDKEMEAYLDFLLDDWVKRETPLHDVLSIFTNIPWDDDLIRRIIEKGAKDKVGIDKMIDMKRTDYLKLLLDKGVVPDVSALYSAIGARSSDIFAMLIKAGVSIDKENYEALTDVTKTVVKNEIPPIKEEIEQILEMLKNINPK